jgi:hypothetical protein
MTLDVPLFYLRPDECPPECPDLDPDDLEELCEKLFLVPEPAVIDLEEEECNWVELIDLFECEDMPGFVCTILLFPPCKL